MSPLILAAALSLLGQSSPDKVIFHDGEFVVKERVRLDVGKEESHRKALFINRVYFGNTLMPDDGRPINHRKATTYYHRSGAVGRILDERDPFPKTPFASDVDPPARIIAAALGDRGPLVALCQIWSEPPIGVVGMHTGTLASYAKPYQSIHFFERNPIIAKLSSAEKGRPLFPAIDDARNRGSLVFVTLGEPRPTIQNKAPKGFFKFLFVEMCQRIYLEDVEVELITKEGLKACVDTLAPDGVVCFHTSNRYLEMSPVIINSAKANGYSAYVIHDPGGGGRFRRPGPNNPPPDPDHFSSEWVIVGRDAAQLKALRDKCNTRDIDWHATTADFPHVWTDQGAKPLGRLLREDPEPLRVSEVICNLIYDVAPISWKETLCRPVGSLCRAWSQVSLARLNAQRVSAEWLRKTP